MIVMLVHWLIRKDRRESFENRWHEMTVAQGSGLYREFLTTVDDTVTNPRFHTFSAVSNPHYLTYINVGVWKSVEDFDTAIGQYIPEATEFEKDGRMHYNISLEAFEFKLRERIVLRVLADRGGELPPAQLAE